jgi:hypothetical protein
MQQQQQQLSSTLVCKPAHLLGMGCVLHDYAT